MESPTPRELCARIAGLQRLSSLYETARWIAAGAPESGERAALETRANTWEVEELLACHECAKALEAIGASFDLAVPHTQYLRGEAFLGLGDLERARQAFDNAYELEPNNTLYADRRLDVPPSDRESIPRTVGSLALLHGTETGALKNVSRLADGNPERFSLEISDDLLARLIADRRISQSSEELAAWTQHVTNPVGTHGDDHRSTMLSYFVGAVGMRAPTRRLARQYSRFLQPIDVLGLLERDLVHVIQRDDLTAADLGSMMDVNLLRIAAGDLQTESTIRILDIGGGYGRLADAVLRTWDVPAHVTMADEIPISLTWAHSYLTARLEHRSISISLDGIVDESSDVAIVPGWHRTRLPDQSFDLAVNIESFQEMPDSEIASWIQTVDRCLCPGGFILISNSRAYVNRSPWPIPESWNLVVSTETPRSWTPDHPTALYRKGPDPIWGSELRRALSSPWKLEPGEQT